MIVFTEILEPTMHIDIEEANAAAIRPGTIVEIIAP
jgi:propanediol utilization protein